MLVHILYSLVGIGFIISQSIVLFSIIKYIGAAYLIYIGWKSLKAQPVKQEVGDEVSKREELSVFASLKIGFLTNVLNPKVTLFFLAFFTQVINPATPLTIQMLYGAVMIVTTITWFSLVALVFSNALVKAKIEGVQHYIERAFGVFLIALGVKVAVSSSD